MPAQVNPQGLQRYGHTYQDQAKASALLWQLYGIRLP